MNFDCFPFLSSFLKDTLSFSKSWFFCLNQKQTMKQARGGGGGGQKRRGEGDSMFSSGSSVGELFEAGQFFQWVAQITFPFLLGSCTEHKFSYSCYVIIDHYVIHIFFFMLPLSNVACPGFRPNFTIDSMQKCQHKSSDKIFSVWSKESFLFLS